MLLPIFLLLLPKIFLGEADPFVCAEWENFIIFKISVFAILSKILLEAELHFYREIPWIHKVTTLRRLTRTIILRITPASFKVRDRASLNRGHFYIVRLNNVRLRHLRE